MNGIIGIRVKVCVISKPMLVLGSIFSFSRPSKYYIGGNCWRCQDITVSFFAMPAEII